MPRFLTQADMEAIFGVTDALGLSREQIKVPLMPSGDGRVERLAGGLIRIVMPENPTSAWFESLRARLEAL